MHGSSPFMLIPGEERLSKLRSGWGGLVGRSSQWKVVALALNPRAQ